MISSILHKSYLAILYDTVSDLVTFVQAAVFFCVFVGGGSNCGIVNNFIERLRLPFLVIFALTLRFKMSEKNCSVYISATRT